MELYNLKRKVEQYKEVLKNTENYREAWKNHLQKYIVEQLENITKAISLEVSIETREDIENLGAIVLSLGDVESGLAKTVGQSKIERPLVKHNGSLIYQQLFNGKIMVLILPPNIEGYGEPQPPRQLAIYRPEEMKEPFFIRHLEELLRIITEWEDYDDDHNLPDEGQKIGFKLNFNQ